MSNAQLALEIDPFDLHALQVKNAKTAFIDVRMPHEVAHAPATGSVNIPLNLLPQNLDQLPKDVDHLVIICAHGRRSLMAAQWLRQNGIHAAQSLVGGMASWRRFEAMAA